MINRLTSNRSITFILAGALVAALLLTVLDITPASSQTPWLRALKVEPGPELMDPWSGVWDDVRPTEVALSAQAITSPLGGGQVRTLRAHALHDGGKLYVMVQWQDKTVDDTANGQTLFTDAAGVQLPSDPGVRVPSFCMGDAQAGVNIWHWKASWQRDINTGFTSSDTLYPDGFADGYLYEDDPIYQPARAVGNALSQTAHVSPVENLIAAGFGTLTTAESQDIAGYGEWRDGRWRVVFARDLQAPAGYPSLAPTGITDIAFAVWDGGSGNRDGLKSVSQFMQLHLLSSALERDDGGFPWWGWAIAVSIPLTGAVALGAVYVGFGSPRRQ